MPLFELDQRRRLAVKGAISQFRKGPPKEDEDVLLAMRRQIVEDCARRLEQEIARLRGLPVTGLQLQIDEGASLALERMAADIRQHVGDHTIYTDRLPQADRTAVEQIRP